MSVAPDEVGGKKACAIYRADHSTIHEMRYTTARNYRIEFGRGNYRCLKMFSRFYASAIQAMLSDSQWLSIKCCPHASNVAPVVITSSTRRILLPLIFSDDADENAEFTFCQREALPFLVCVVVAFNL